ncbi:PRC-barrel domain-containing protein [Altericroceibacterium xinjiangense]|uniref:PRC-barrel domain-containing protein n=1 Tax=Altericroceibacterium xinjiangense TaxID=762261 RepID=UPI000F7EE844|nr:PRC-barrel domain-containing protein [Altericroceibacterium xinjiangense]
MNQTIHKTDRATAIPADLEQRTAYSRSRPLKRDETTDLIASDKVKNTDVYSTNGDKLGYVDHMMIGKLSGRVEYAVMNFGGFLGIGEKHHPLPWDVLDYDTAKEGYVVNIDKERLKQAPSFPTNQPPAFDRTYGEEVYRYYGTIY